MMNVEAYTLGVVTGVAQRRPVGGVVKAPIPTAAYEHATDRVLLSNKQPDAILPGFAAHEAGHKRYTDKDEWEALAKQTGHGLVNCLEDCRVNALVRRDTPFAGSMIDDTWRHLLAETPVKPTMQPSMAVLYHVASNGQVRLDQCARPADLDKLRAYLDKHRKTIESAPSLADLRQAALDLQALDKSSTKPPPPPPQDDEEESESKDEEESESKDEEESESKDEEESEGQDEEESEGQGEEESEGQGEEESEGQGEEESEGQGEEESEGQGEDESEGQGEDESESKGEDESESKGEDESESKGDEESPPQDNPFGESNASSGGETNNGEFDTDPAYGVDDPAVGNVMSVWRNRLADSLRSTAEVGKVQGCKRGRLDVSRLSRVYTSPRVFTQRGEPQTSVNTAVDIVLDCSGSMFDFKDMRLPSGPAHRIVAQAALACAVMESMARLDGLHTGVLLYAEDTKRLRPIIPGVPKLRRDQLIYKHSYACTNTDVAVYTSVGDLAACRRVNRRICLLLTDDQAKPELRPFAGQQRVELVFIETAPWSKYVANKQPVPPYTDDLEGNVFRVAHETHDLAETMRRAFTHLGIKARR